MKHFQQENNRIIWTGKGEVVWIESYGENIIRVRASKNLKIELKVGIDFLNFPLMQISSTKELLKFIKAA